MEAAETPGIHRAGTHRWTLGSVADSPRLLYLAVEAGVSLWTSALVRPIAVLTRASVQAWLGVTLINVMLAVAAREAGWTDAGEGVDAIHTGPTVEAGAGNRHQVTAGYTPHQRLPKPAQGNGAVQGPHPLPPAPTKAVPTAAAMPGCTSPCSRVCCSHSGCH